MLKKSILLLSSFMVAQSCSHRSQADQAVSQLLSIVNGSNDVTGVSLSRNNEQAQDDFLGWRDQPVSFVQEIPVVEASAVMTPVVESSAVMTPVVESSAVMTPVVEASAVMTPVVEASAVMTPVVESSAVMTPVVESSAVMTPVVEASAVMTPVVEASAVMIPVVESSAVMTPVVESSAVMTPVAEASAVMTPVVESSAVPSPTLPRNEPTVSSSPISVPVASQHSNVIAPRPVMSSSSQGSGGEASSSTRGFSPNQNDNQDSNLSSITRQKTQPTSVEPQIQRGPEIKQVAGMSGSLIKVELEQDGWVLMTKTNTRLPLVSRTTTNMGNTAFSLRGQEPGRYELEFGRQTSTGFDKRLVLVQVSPYQQSFTPPLDSSVNELRSRDNQTSDLGAFIQSSPQAKELAGRRDDLRSQQERLGLEDLYKAFNILMTDAATQPFGIEVGSVFTQRFYRHPYTAGVLFSMAQFLESQGSNRNLQQAYGYYERVFNEFPINPLSRSSRERMDHLDRFFLRIN